jgi:hypothetical protein
MFCNPSHTVYIQAWDLYYRAFRFGWLVRLWFRLTRRCTDLLHLRSASIHGTTVQHTEVINLQTIHGTENRLGDFDSAFRPLRDANADRWIAVAAARLQGKALPPVELIQLDGEYYVRDGHHRISVARAMGERYIDAVVMTPVQRILR